MMNFMKDKRHDIKIPKSYFPGLLLVLLLFVFSAHPVYTQLSIHYTSDPVGKAYACINRGDEKTEKKVKVVDGAVSLYFWGPEFQSLSPIDFDSYEELYLDSMEIRMYGIPVLHLTPEDMAEAFVPNEDFSHMGVEDAGLNLLTCGQDPRLIPTEAFLAGIKAMASWMSLLQLVFYVLVYSLLYWYAVGVLDIFHDHSYENMLDLGLGIAGVAAVLLSFGIAVNSDCGPIVHPDEVQTKAAVEYYETHVIQPDVRSELVAGTVSGYGMTRLSETNLYYLFAGKLSRIVPMEMSFRALGMLMILILLIFVLKRIRTDRYLTVCFFLTPQLWYLYSYATSDAYDYLIAVLVTYELLSAGSSLNRMLSKPRSAGWLQGLLLNGFLFANVLMAKKTFYLVLLLAAVLLLQRLAGSGQRRRLLVKYTGLLGVALFLVLLRSIPDFGYYGIHKSTAVAQVIEATAKEEYKPSTPAADQAESTLLYEKGVSLKDFFTEYHFNGALFKNFAGYYGIYRLEARTWYYLVYGAGFITLLAGGLLLLRRHWNFTCTAMCALMVLMYLLTVYNAYFVDFQPQGRYLFPALPALAALLAQQREVLEHRGIRTVITGLAVLSLYSFFKIAYLGFL